tara:strand:- start:929 stop:1342 length:414 start_codon:yes stop_codon:yes gene_type:complete
MLKSQIEKDKKKEIADNAKKTDTKKTDTRKSRRSSAPYDSKRDGLPAQGKMDKGVKQDVKKTEGKSKKFVPLIDRVTGKNSQSEYTAKRLKAAKGKKSQDTLDAMSFSKAFKAEQARLGEGKKFNWKGKSYTTNSKK